MYWIGVLTIFWLSPWLAAMIFVLPSAVSPRYRRWLAVHLFGAPAFRESVPLPAARQAMS